jgi:hypothetical protein
MTATAAQIAKVRRMVNEPTETTYDDETIQEYIETYPLTDARGEVPLIESTTTPGTLDENEDWIATYDLAAAAADIWGEKAAVLSQDYDFDADGAKYTRSQAYEQAMKQARYYRARRSVGTITQSPQPLLDASEDLTN